MLTSWKKLYKLKHLFFSIFQYSIALTHHIIPVNPPPLPGVSRVRAWSPAWTGSPAQETYISCTYLFLPHNLPPTILFLLSSVTIVVYNRSAISVNRGDVSYQFLSSFSRLFVQKYETDCCLRNRTDIRNIESNTGESTR
jgi:hypothetical protein